MMNNPGQTILTQEQKAQFAADGYLVLKGFYDSKSQIIPIQKAIFEIIRLVAKKHNIPLPVVDFLPSHFDAGFETLIRHDRKLGSVVYDAVKHIPAFVRLLSCEANEKILRELRGTDMAAIEAGGYGIRIDIPFEDQFRTPWHQDFTSHFRSMDGITMWSTLVELTPDMGPVEICKASHKEGPFPIFAIDPNSPDARGGVGFHIHNEADVIGRFERVAPLSVPGDLILIDWMTVHQSGRNISNRSRWSTQLRYFNYREPWGIKKDWRGAFAAGNSPLTIIPEYVVNKKN